MLILDDATRDRLGVPRDMVGVFDGSSFLHVTCFATDVELSAALSDGGSNVVVLSSDVFRMGIDATCLSCGGHFADLAERLSVVGPPVADGSLVVMGVDGKITSSTYVGRAPTRGARGSGDLTSSLPPLPAAAPPVTPSARVASTSQLLPYVVDHGGDQYIVCARGPAELDLVIQERRAARAARAERASHFLPPAIPRITSVDMLPLRAEEAAICLADMARSLSTSVRAGVR